MTNVCVFMGNLVKEPEIRQTKTGKSWCTLTIALPNSYRKDAEALFLNCRSNFEYIASYVEQYVHKGDTVSVVGKLNANNYVDKANVKHYGVVLDFTEIRKIRSPKGSASSADNESVFTGLGSTNDKDDEWPF